MRHVVKKTDKKLINVINDAAEKVVNRKRKWWYNKESQKAVEVREYETERISDAIHQIEKEIKLRTQENFIKESENEVWIIKIKRNKTKGKVVEKEEQFGAVWMEYFRDSLIEKEQEEIKPEVDSEEALIEEPTLEEGINKEIINKSRNFKAPGSVFSSAIERKTPRRIISYSLIPMKS